MTSDGTQVAIVTWDDLYIVSLLDGSVIHLDVAALYPTWSADGQALYFWAISVDDPARSPTKIQRYDLKSGTLLDVINQTSLEQSLGGKPHSPFAISPTEARFLFRLDEQLWVIEF